MKENFNPIGKVEIIDLEDNKVVYSTHNMIVKEGRMLIRNAIFKRESLDYSKFYKFYETGTDDTLTTADTNYSNRSSYIKEDSAILSNDYLYYPSELSGVTYTETDELGAEIATSDAVKYYRWKDTISGTNPELHLYMKLEVFKSAKEPITAIGLIYKDGVNTKLFSRAAIEPTYMRYGRTYVVKYTLYF